MDYMYKSILIKNKNIIYVNCMEFEKGFKILSMWEMF